ncbi:DUF1570 domain-containing protein [Algisphaera agarilytica]|uniref:DUF1570 domain-containing protein n=1 Tax=Algisphaera agarilytica TaxID=1385975 RepID=A0A7X0LLN0_9BACT|nr:DUF1570 domain-containing protein [Algisphaera agarilytica]MBB6431084.1 hypothetical protein [Algisphaera agarilytica]
MTRFASPFSLLRAQRQTLHGLAGVGMLVLGALLVFGTAPEATAQPRGLSKFESRAYVIHTNLTKEEALEYGVHMDLIYKEYSKRFSVLEGKGRGKQDLYLLRTRQDYIRAMAAFGLQAEASGGMFFWGPGISGLATWVEGLSRDQVFSTLQHEGFHQFAYTKMGENLPLWVNEGLAEYFGAAIVVEGKVRMGIVDEDRVERVRRALEAGQALTFRELLGIQSNQWHQNMLSGSHKGYLQYDQSWAVVHFLVHGDKGRYKKAFGNYLVLISQGATHDQAFSRTFGDDTRKFEARWENFIEKVEPDHYSMALKRMQFLGEGLRFLESQNVDTPKTTRDLRKALQARGFRLTWVTQAGKKVVDSDDSSLYSYKDSKGNTQRFEIIPAEEDSELPPSMSAPKLKPVVSLTWIKDDQGNLRSQLEYGKKRRR